jgi:hypothetical protein
MYPKDMTFYTNSDFSKLCFCLSNCLGDGLYTVIKNPFTIKQYGELESSNREIPRQLLLQNLIIEKIEIIQYYNDNSVIMLFKNGNVMIFSTEMILRNRTLPDCEYGLVPHLVVPSDISDIANTTVNLLALSCNDKYPQEVVVNQRIPKKQFDIPYDIITELRIESLNTPRLRDKMSKLIHYYQLSDEALVERLLLNDSSPENNRMIDMLFELRYFYPIHSRRDFSIELFEKYQKGYLLKLLTKHIAGERNRKNKFKRFSLTHDFVSIVRETKPDKTLICELLDEIANGKCMIKADVFHVLMKEMI